MAGIQDIKAEEPHVRKHDHGHETLIDEYSYVTDMSTIKTHRPEEVEMGIRASGNFKSQKAYFDGIKEDRNEPFKTRLFFKLFFTLVYFICMSFYLFTYIRKFDNNKDLSFADWSKRNISIEFVRDYLLCLVGYVILMQVLNVLFKN